MALDAGDAQVSNQDGQIDLRGMPDVDRLRPLLSDDHSARKFETALETLLDRVETSVSQ